MKSFVPYLLFFSMLWSSGCVNSLRFTGVGDGSAGVAVSDRLFCMGSDEENVLRFYTPEGGRALESFDLGTLFTLGGNSLEMDIEGAARIKGRTYWITSHSANRKGKSRPNRRFLFALDIEDGPSGISCRAVGKPYCNLVEDLAGDPRYRSYNLEKAARQPPKQKTSLNIEALSAGDNGSLLIGFRSPLPREKALLVFLLNPEDLLQRGKKPRFSDPVLLDLGGSGIRGACKRQAGGYWLLTGSPGKGGKSNLYFWDGKGSARAIGLPSGIPGHITLETLFEVGEGEERCLWFFSDNRSSVSEKKRVKENKEGKTPSAEPFFNGFSIPCSEIRL